MESNQGVLGMVKNGPPADLLGITPVDLARAAGHATLADMLQQHYYGERTGFIRDKGWHAHQKLQ